MSLSESGFVDLWVWPGFMASAIVTDLAKLLVFDADRVLSDRFERQEESMCKVYISENDKVGGDT